MQTIFLPLKNKNWLLPVLAWMVLILLVAGCTTEEPLPTPTTTPTASPTPAVSPTPIPTRPAYSPGELVSYQAQAGDTLHNLAVRFNTSADAILEANPVIPSEATTLPPGLPMDIPIYYESLWGTAYKIIPNSLFINGPAQRGFNTSSFVDSHSGWLKSYRQFAAGKNRTGAEIVDLVASNFSISPRLLLVLLEYQTQALSDPVPPPDVDRYPLGHRERGYDGLYIQLVWAANRLNQGYYRWLGGELETLEHPDGTIEHPDPWQNAATVALQNYYALIMSTADYDQAIGQDGFAAVYRSYFPHPWSTDPHIPGSLSQPALQLPFEGGETWALTGGPHTGWGQGKPWSALDFAPPSVAGGCQPSNKWAVAAASGLVTRSEEGIVELDLDEDGDPRTGWVLFYLHIGNKDRVPAGTRLEAGDPIGHPSCEGGESTGSHIHIARKYNGEWIPAGGTIPFNLGGWIARDGNQEYQGSLTRFTKTVTASFKAEENSHLTAEN